ncbi:uncharacterized protein LAESUDRAFT_765353 [Laetiporus sulphureus 93-53]|uniref:Uncharacterized protein n=1 Tax=Laetiporus sulphureus 93-53 TaxID=1314785 RepID=A0A165AT55_9APHY|nr:uncharacterized protein LAESUDRAFT_765353 [Laetiporus sulphureus 93-53]KZS99610.1 hypothetical protein LAESUDRAFT_765353 [Laetiporus sulphureus 93-53]
MATTPRPQLELAPTRSCATCVVSNAIHNGPVEPPDHPNAVRSSHWAMTLTDSPS